MIFTVISFDDRLENPVIIFKDVPSSLTNNYYALENPLTGHSVIFYTFILQKSTHASSSPQILLPKHLEPLLFQNPEHNRILKIRKVSPFDNGNFRVRIKLKHAISENNNHHIIQQSHINIFLFELSQKVNLQEALYTRLALKDQLICTKNYFAVSIFKWILIWKVQTINNNNKAPKAIEYNNFAIPVDEDTRFSINFFNIRPNYAGLLNNLLVPNNKVFIQQLELMFTQESERDQSTLFSKSGPTKLKRLISLASKGLRLSVLPQVCLLQAYEDSNIIDNLLQIYLKDLQKNIFTDARLLYMEAFDPDASTGNSEANVKAVKAMVRAASVEEDTLMLVFFSGMKVLQASKKDNSFIKFVSEEFKRLKKALLLVPMYIDKEADRSGFAANEEQVNHHESVEILFDINLKILKKKLKNFEYMSNML